MKLLVDIGNSRIKWICIESGRLTEPHRFDRSKTGIKASLNKHWKTLTEINSIYVANVAGDKIAQQLTDWTQSNWDLTPHFINSEQKKFGVTNSYNQPEQLGVDRWLSLIAARQHARQATCIIDCGTAITIDIVTKYGIHQGGMILPGLSLMRSSLADKTDALDVHYDQSEFKTLAISTASAIQTGTLYTVTACLERIIDDLNNSYDHHIRFIITGGDAELLMPLLPSAISHYPDIVLKGLAYYARQGNKKARTPQQLMDIEQEGDDLEISKLPEMAI